MTKLTSVLLGFALFMGIFAFVGHADAYVSVKGYYRSNGTYVKPYVRSSPNALRYDNYSYKPSSSLYNSSYYTPTKNYTSSWYTPSYITDPYYYSGLSQYRYKTCYSFGCY